MAKKNTRKRKKQQRSIIRPIPTTLFTTLALLLALAISMFYDYYSQNPQEVKDSFVREVTEFLSDTNFQFDLPTPSHSKSTVSSSSASASSPKTTIKPDGEIPQALENTSEEFISHTGFTLSYNETWRLPNWVAYELTIQETKGKSERTNQFTEDPLITGQSATDKDYYRSGYDRGHMAPAGDMKWNEEAMDESFYLSNICPQAPSLNRGVWRILEEKLRETAQKDSAIWIVCGPIVKNGSKTLGKNKVKIPHSFFKVIITPYTDPIKGIGFIFPNEDCNQELSTYAVTIDDVEKITGINFFYRLPTSIEEGVEAQCNLSQWDF